MSRPPISAAIITAIQSAIADGTPPAEIASDYGIGISTVNKYAKGLPRRNTRGKNGISQALREEIQQRRATGLRLAELQALYPSVKRGQIWYAIRQVQLREPIKQRHSHRLRKPEVRRLPDSMSTTDRGKVSLYMAILHAVRAGYDPYPAFRESTPIDLIIGYKNQLARCQCKTLRLTKSGAHTLSLCTGGDRVARAANKPVRYSPADVDAMLGYCPENGNVYVLRLADIPEQTATVSLWITSVPLNPAHTRAGAQYEGRFDTLFLGS